ncbi:tyrosine-type recombinase/integrase [Herbidospora mongoliensis]|uniref:tyrosine-type recombinase/integrase n=1 Tax=Herbidospora mongoliensis TaxID=688067 RepID=UPI00082A9644|nr:tyrosine-type recombinase/integrase [Herbidospora mongoliensis]
MTSGKTRSRAVPLSAAHTTVLADYAAALTTAPLAGSTQDKYVSRLRGYLSWLAQETFEGDPLTDAAAASLAVRAFRHHLKDAHRAPTTIDTYLSALDDFYARRGVGKPQAGRERDPRRQAPRSLDAQRVRRYLAQVRHTATPRDRAIALLPYLAGLRISEVVGLDLTDVRTDGLGVRGGKARLVPVHPELRQVLTGWLEVRAGWKGASVDPALFLNHRGFRLSDRAARDIITGFADPDDPFSPLVLRHTFATQLIRDGKDPIVVAELLGLESLDSTRRYGLPVKTDREAVLNSLITDI